MPGQYVTVLMPVPGGIRQPRQYSLTRADDGEHPPALLHDTIGVGDVVTLSLPYGDVVLDDAGRPVVFLSAGIGIAPWPG